MTSYASAAGRPGSGAGVGADAAVNLYSDTQTRPSEAMLAAMSRAPVGDEQRFADPTVNELCERVAELLGHEAAVFLPTGTMCNAIGFRLHLRAGGEEVLLHRLAHPVVAETGSPAALCGTTLNPIDSEDGTFGAEELRGALHPGEDRYMPRSRLLSVEQTANLTGGRVWLLERMREVVGAAREAGLRTHLDGARLMNAVVASGVPAAEWAGQFDTAWIDFSKGLGAPIGACLAGSEELIEEAWRHKQMLGGAMRQAGVVAAAALYGLDHHVERLAEDHARARRLADGFAAIEGIEVDPGKVETNIVIFRVSDAEVFQREMAERGVSVGALGVSHGRAITHLDIDDAGVERAIEAAAEAVGAR